MGFSIFGIGGLSVFGNAIVGTDGLDYNPGSDVDVDLITVGVTGTPTVIWDETEDRFLLSHGLNLASGVALKGVGTGANGVVITNPKNAVASSLTGTQLDVEIDIGGSAYHFTVYPTKA